MVLHSILFDKPEKRAETQEAPDFFVDLNLDQIINAVTAAKAEYNLKPFFYTPLRDINTVEYRHEVMSDLENEVLSGAIKSFAQKMRTMRLDLSLAEKLYYERQKEQWFLRAAEVYYDAVTGLRQDLASPNVRSRGLSAFRDYLTSYTHSRSFTALLSDTQKLRADLSTIHYCLWIKGNRIEVRKYESETDYSVEVMDVFERFKQGAVKDYRVKILDGPADMNHVEASILDLVARLYPDIFQRLGDYCDTYAGFADKTITVFDREVQFYAAYLDYVATFKAAGLQFCYPIESDTCKEVYAHEAFDAALANKLIANNAQVVCNDFSLEGSERIIVVSGPNQGGKTTFARTFGQLHYLAALGCPVPGREAQLFLFDTLFTHFEKEEDIETGNGKLQDDLVRVHAILRDTTPNSIIILNEIFTSTTLTDATLLSKKVMEIIMELDLLCVCVTFIDELSSLSEKTVSMMSTVVPDSPAQRTFKVVRRPADGLAYALSIADKHHLTYSHLKERMNHEGISDVQGLRLRSSSEAALE